MGYETLRVLPCLCSYVILSSAILFSYLTVLDSTRHPRSYNTAHYGELKTIRDGRDGGDLDAAGAGGGGGEGVQAAMQAFTSENLSCGSDLRHLYSIVSSCLKHSPAIVFSV